MIATLITILVAVVIVGVVLYIAKIILAQVPMEPWIKQIAMAILILIAILVIVWIIFPGVSMPAWLGRGR